jgi:hypothetical protein
MTAQRKAATVKAAAFSAAYMGEAAAQARRDAATAAMAANALAGMLLPQARSARKVAHAATFADIVDAHRTLGEIIDRLNLTRESQAASGDAP